MKGDPNMTYKALAIAKFVTNYAVEQKNPINNTKLNKILYYLQGFHYSLFKTPLFNDKIEAWGYGPTIPSVYEEYSIFGLDPIPPVDDALSYLLLIDQPKKAEDYANTFDEQTKEFLYRYTKRLLVFPTLTLVDATQYPGGPWSQYFEPFQKREIPDFIMMAHFIDLAEKIKEV